MLQHMLQGYMFQPNVLIENSYLTLIKSLLVRMVLSDHIS